MPWLSVRSCKALVSALTVQVLVQRTGFTIRLLQAELKDLDEPDEADLGEREQPRF